MGSALRLWSLTASFVFVLAGCAGAATDPDTWAEAIEARDLGTIDALLDDPDADPNQSTADGKSALMLAAQQGDADMVARLIAAGADINATNPNGGTPLMYASLGGNPEVTAQLLAAGARPGEKAKLGWTALAVAAVKGRTDVIRVLLEAGADQQVQDTYGWTPLMRAADSRRLEVVRVLLGSPGVNLDARQEYGQTALHIAAAAGDDAIVNLLVASGADVTARDNRGNTPAAIARLADHAELAEQLDRARQRGTSGTG
jgi:ankyrin repeat protein